MYVLLRMGDGIGTGPHFEAWFPHRTRQKNCHRLFVVLLSQASLPGVGPIMTPLVSYSAMVYPCSRRFEKRHIAYIPI